MVNLFAVYSKLENKSNLVEQNDNRIKRLLEKNPELKMCGYFSDIKILEQYLSENECSNSPVVIYNITGGTEDLINIITRKSNSPVLILADQKKNSFASSLESFSYLKENYPVKIFFGISDEEKIEAVKLFVSVITALEKVNKSHFCLIGDPSEWLLTSRDFNGFGNFKTKFTKLEIQNLISKVEKVSDSKARKVVDKWKSSFSEISVDNKSLLKSAKVKFALQEIIDELNVNVLSVRCFDLLKFHYTACMGLSECNDTGVTAGCEGDIPATFSMMIAQHLTGDAAWMANPSSIDKKNNEIVFAHCTVPVSFIEDVNKAGLTSHMESGESTAVRGPLRKTDVTVLRINSKYNKLSAAGGRIIDSDMQDINLCRTQAKIKINGSVDKWVDNALGNHHVIVYGDIIEKLRLFCELSNTELLAL